MRSESPAEGGHEVLPLGLTPGPGRVVAARRGRRPRGAGPALRATFRVGDGLAAPPGWPVGTEVVVDPARRPARGDLVVVRDGGCLVVGVYDRTFGRPVARTGRSATWVGPGLLVGVVTLVGAALDGMPDPLS